MRDLLEVAVGYGLILAALWSGPTSREVSAWIVLVLIPDARRGDRFGLRLKGMRESLWALALAIAVCVIAVFIAAALGTLHYHYVRKPYPPMSGYLLWALVQEFILQNFILARLLRLLGRPWLAIGGAGLLLSMAHLPNLLLMATTLFWGIAACWLFFRYRNLYVVGFIHFLLGIALAICVPASIQHNMRVGHGYVTFHSHSSLRSALEFGATPSARRSSARIECRPLEQAPE
jgi:Type II CAAX prenyl endopeptidase Rce1-like